MAVNRGLLVLVVLIFGRPGARSLGGFLFGLVLAGLCLNMEGTKLNFLDLVGGVSK